MPEPREILGDYVFALIQNLSRRKDIPDVVIDDVFAIKKIADRVDGRIHANTVCMVLISHGYSADDNKYGFERGEWSKDETSIEGAIDKVESIPAIVKPAAEKEVVEVIDKGDGNPGEAKEVEVAASPLSDIDEGPQPLAKDTKVRFAHDGKHVEGVIASSVIEDEDIFYGIDVDGFEETITKHEDDVIEIK